MYINSINYFRGISIILIVFGHSLEVAEFHYESIIGNTVLNLTQGGTAFFVFISGFLFHHIFYKKFELRRFMVKKTQSVLLPYLILSTILVIYWLQQKEALSFFAIARHYLTGDYPSFIGYWYIPFIMVIFAISPIFIRFIKLKSQFQLLVAFALLICSVYMHRGPFLTDYMVFQNVLYFVPIYLIGIISSKNKEVIFTKIKGHEYHFLIFAILIAAYQANLGELGNYHKAPFTYRGMDLMIIQKVFLCLFFLVFLNRFENYKIRALEIVAANSFGIFFLHGIFIWILGIIKTQLGYSFTSNSFITYIAVASLVFFLALFVTVLLKKALPKYSRYLVGS